MASTKKAARPRTKLKEDETPDTLDYGGQQRITTLQAERLAVLTVEGKLNSIEDDTAIGAFLTLCYALTYTEDVGEREEILTGIEMAAMPTMRCTNQALKTLVADTLIQVRRGAK
jgi:hypothetical protein